MELNTIKVIILAAGLGTRLRELISDKPKCMVHVNGRPIIGWQLSALIESGLTDIAIVTGYHASILQEYVATAFPGTPIKFIHSEDHATTNNMYSLWLTREHVGAGSLLYMNADVAFEPEVIARLLKSKRTSVAVDEGSYNEESMKVVRSDSGLLAAISKQIPKEHSLGSSIDVYFFEPADAQILYAECERIIKAEKQLKQWSELALHRLLETGRIQMVSVNVAGLDWYEIDNSADLAIAETLFTASALRRNPPKVYFLDLDGTVYLGNQNIDGAEAFVDQIREQGAQVVFLSNNSSKSHADYVKRLKNVGIDAERSDILLSTDPLGSHLRESNVTRAYILGTSSMREVLASYGVVHEETNPQAVLLGYHTELTYKDISTAALILQQQDVPYFASHLDKVCPTERGPIPDAGALAELLFITTGRRPERVFGKPSSDFVQARMRSLGVAPEDCVVIGDRVYTDLALARAAGMRFVGVLSGEGRRKDFEGEENLLIATSLGHIARLGSIY